MLHVPQQVFVVTDKVLFQDSGESNDYYSLLSFLPPSPEFPFSQESSSPPLSPLPHVEQRDLDIWLNNGELDEENPGEM